MSKPTVAIIGVPSDLGANVRGANIGPSAVRIAGLHEKLSVIGYDIVDMGDVAVDVREALPRSVQDNKYLSAIVAICETVKQLTINAMKAGHIPLIIGGDHSVAIGSFGGVSSFYKAKNERVGMIWIDAHADLNTPQSSPSGNIHGMPLGVMLGQGHDELTNIGGPGAKVRPENVALIGIRMIDGDEKALLKKSGIRYFTMREVDERGMFLVMKEAIAIATNGTSGIHLSFDIDGIDPLYAPGVSTPVSGGLSYREAHLALEMIADTRLLHSMEFVELNPSADTSRKTADLTVELIQSALGKSIV